MSPYRDVLDESAVTGVDYRTATSTIPEGERPSPQSWQNHVRLHLFRYDEMFDSARPGARRGVTGRDDGGDRSNVDAAGFLRSVVASARSALADGDRTPTTRDGIAAMKELLAMGDVVGTEDRMNMWREAFVIYMEEAGEIMDSEQRALFFDRLQENPVLNQLIEESDRRWGRNRD